MPKAKKSQPNMGLLVDAVDSNPELLMLLQRSHIPEHWENLSSQLCEHFAEISGWRKNDSKDIYSDFLNFLWYGISASSQWVALI